MKYKYFISYNVLVKDKGSILGNAFIDFTRKINSMEDIREVEQIIKNEVVLPNGMEVEQVVVINYVLMSES